ncbi:MAG: NUDIX hydrolase [Chloroflexi bacterium]|nr:NUDIX hydrolase [Chloroflexota bacterium]
MRQAVLRDNPVRSAVALVVRQPGRAEKLLVVKRPADDPELPGLWGLPAASAQRGETPEQTAQRLARDKLGASLRLVGMMAEGSQQRNGYLLKMALYLADLERREVRLAPRGGRGDSVTYYTAWRWAMPAALKKGAQRGSLCCRLLLDSWKSAGALASPVEGPGPRC